jgi:hypothetical protein
MTPTQANVGRPDRETRLSVALVAVFIPTYATMLYLQAGLMVVGIVAGAIGIYHRHPLGNFIAWLFFVGMMVGEPTHLLVFPLMEGGRYHYFPGMWTALAPMAPAAYGIWRMLADDRAAMRERRGVRPPPTGIAASGVAGARAT